jgi:hypothetical protein
MRTADPVIPEPRADITDGDARSAVRNSVSPGKPTGT